MTNIAVDWQDAKIVQDRKGWRIETLMDVEFWVGELTIPFVHKETAERALRILQGIEPVFE